MSDLEDTYYWAYEQLMSSGREWRMDGELRLPTYEDVRALIDSLVYEVKQSPEPISVACGGLLVQRVDDYIDIYIHVGEIKEEE